MDPIPSAPAPGPMRPRRSFSGPIILICIGVFFLVVNLMPSLDPWAILARYWPVILIVVGLGQVWDYFFTGRYAGGGGGAGFPGIIIAVVLLMLLLGILGTRRRNRDTKSFENHNSQTVDLQGATSVSANLNLPAGQLNVKGGSSHLVEADFAYDNMDAPPKIDYSVNGGQGDLSVNEPDSGVHFGTHDDTWNLQFNDDVPLDMTLQMGAGQDDLEMADVNLTRLEVHMGAGQMTLDLTGPRKHDLSVDIQGGVGQATIRLPKDVGVRAHASGGIGTVSVKGLTKNGDEYVNAVYGKTPTTIDVTVNGGIGVINLEQE